MTLRDLQDANWTLRWKEEEARLPGNQAGELLAVFALWHLAGALGQSETQAQAETRGLGQRTGGLAVCRALKIVVHLDAWMAKVGQVLAVRA